MNAAPVATLIENNILRDNRFSGLQIQHGRHVVARRNLLENNDSAGIYVTGEVVDCRLEKNIIRDNDGGRDDVWNGGIIIHGGERIVIRDNEIYDTRRGDARTQTVGLRLTSQQGPLSQVEVRGNRFENNLEYGLLLESVAPVDRVTIADNHSSGDTRYAIGIVERNGGTIKNLKICGNDLDDSLRGAIQNDTALIVENGRCGASGPR